MMKKQLLYLTILGLTAFAAAPSFAAPLTEGQRGYVDSLISKLYSDSVLSRSKQYRRSFRRLLEDVQPEKRIWRSENNYNRSANDLEYILKQLKAGKNNNFIALDNYFATDVGASSWFGTDFFISDYLEARELREALYSLIAEEMPHIVGRLLPQQEERKERAQETTATRRALTEGARALGVGLTAAGAERAMQAAEARQAAAQAQAAAQREALEASRLAREAQEQGAGSYTARGELFSRQAAEARQAQFEQSLAQQTAQESAARIAAGDALEAAQAKQALYGAQTVPSDAPQLQLFEDVGAEEALQPWQEEYAQAVEEQAAQQAQQATEAATRPAIQQAIYARQALPVGTPSSAAFEDPGAELVVKEPGFWSKISSGISRALSNASASIQKATTQIEKQGSPNAATATTVQTTLDNTATNLENLSDKLENLASSEKNPEAAQKLASLTENINAAENVITKGSDAFQEQNAAGLQQAAQEASAIAAAINAGLQGFGEMFGETQFDYSSIGDLEGIGRGLGELFQALGAAAEATEGAELWTAGF